ncbi:MAG: single-stranded DNA-binding protein [Candidatus Nitrohelix vancouverensis]|uniref:Single-stranded DNA-binding protein n=1 Tax=Candidatus Nitrohelix vancouverensis TaxID=2705534 RepID=A0A7T0G4A6_9BACT|nr:MAG: single-stranded DNA-binding protein [Candidatus Nitrohelix vancouverensis]
MASFNKVLLMGNLTRDPELRYTASGAAVASFGIAVNRKFKQGDEWKDDVCFVDITVWGKQGENCAEYLSKGRPVFIEGYLRFSSWEGDGGQKRNKLDVTANTVQFLGGRGDGQRSGPNDPGDSSGMPPGDDDVPF